MATTDVDECTLGAHDCGPMYQCRNTQGSFRCVPKRCEQEDQMLDPGTGECKVQANMSISILQFPL
jgi:hypothetical protein